MDIIGEERGRLERLTTWLDATRAELTGLLVLLVGAVVATGALWWSAAGPVPPAPVSSNPAADSEAVGASPGQEPQDGRHDRLGAADAAIGGTDPSVSGGGDGEQAPLTVHVTGAVASPGVVTVEAGARVADAIAAAGEATSEAQPHRLNLARPVTDGERVHVPREGDQVPADEVDGTTTGLDAQGRVDLNRADGATLETLTGIGPARAEAIIDHREQHGPFAQPGDLRDVSGIGEATFQRLAEDITVS